MQVGRWGDSLAIRLPTDVVDALGIEEGDEIEIEVVADRLRLHAARGLALAKLRALRQPSPPGFRFTREDANSR